MADSNDYLDLARTAARYAHEGLFSHRRGILPSDPHLVIIYDNNPTSGRGREKVLAVAREAAEEQGAKLVGEAGYPIGGPSDGYTVAMVFEATADEEVGENILEEMWDAFAKEAP